MAAERTGALVVRAWVEPGQDAGGGLRARITYAADLSSENDETVRLATTRDQILGTVTAWLDELTGRRLPHA